MNQQLALQTLVTAVAGGSLLFALSRKTSIPAIVLLLAAGVLLGPEMLNIIRPDSLGYVFPAGVALAVGLVLFEGGISLDLQEYRKTSRVIQRMLTVGVLVTWLATAALVYALLELGVFPSLLAASLVVVTGPTVIVPLLKRVKLIPRIRSILHWEAVLVDPIGVFLAVLCFEYFGDERGWSAAGHFAMRIAAGLAIGISGGLALYWCLKKRLIPTDMTGGFCLAVAALVFGLAETVIGEAGLLATTVAGLTLGIKRPAELKYIRSFKGEITDLLIGMLFLLLAARLSLSQFQDFGWNGVLVVVGVMVLVRPLSIVISSSGSDLSSREKAFLAWVAPRGLVSASMASLFRLQLEQNSLVKNPEAIETFVYSVVVATVVLQGFSAGPFAAALGLQAEKLRGWMVIGAHRLGREFARFAVSNGEDVCLIDTNDTLVRNARKEGLNAVAADARDLTLLLNPRVAQFGKLLAATDNEDLNSVVCQRWLDTLGPENVYRWASSDRAVDAPGKIVWDELEKPTYVSQRINKGELQMLGAGGGESAICLASAVGNEVIIDQCLADNPQLVLGTAHT